MWIALIVVIVVVAGVVVAKLAWRSNGDEVHSVRSYQSALGTMEDLASRNVKPVVKPVEPLAGPAGSGRSDSVPPVPVRGSDSWPDPEAPLVFEDGRPKDRYGRAPVSEVAPAFRSDRARKQAIQSMNHRPRRWVATVVVIVVVAAFAALALVGSHRSKPPAGGHAGSPTTATHTTTHTTTATHTTTHTTTSTPAKHGKHGTTKPTTTTMPPTQIVATSSSPTGTSAVYPVASGSYQVTITATGECWVDATTLSSGSTLWTGTLQAGASQVVLATGAISLELGSPAATLAVDDLPVVFPTPLHTPFTARFEPTTPATTTTATTTTIAATTAP